MNSEFSSIKSSNLVAARHDGKDKCQVQFKNGTYEYEGVSPEMYAQFEATFQTEESSGKFFQKNIRPLKFKKL
jgi:hypothetical protein